MRVGLEVICWHFLAGAKLDNTELEILLKQNIQSKSPTQASEGCVLTL